MGYSKFVYYSVDCFYQALRTYLPWLYAFVDLLTLALVDLVRLAPGRRVAQGIERCNRPEKPLRFYEYEGCPFCRRVRETLAVLDIDYECYPCPRETFNGYGKCLNSRFRPEVKKDGGTAMFPFIVDPNTNQKMYHSNEIMAYLWKTYGEHAKAPLNYRIAFSQPWLDISNWLTIFLRPSLDMGWMRAPARIAEQPLELWAHESSGSCRRVRETLCVLELPYLLHNVPMGSVGKRKEFLKEHEKEISAWRKRLGLIKIPYLYDPNAKVGMFESSEIVRYLKDKYQTAALPAETWLDFN